MKRKITRSLSLALALIFALTLMPMAGLSAPAGARYTELVAPTLDVSPGMFSEGLAFVRTNGAGAQYPTWGYMDAYGDIVISLDEYDENPFYGSKGAQFSDGLAVVWKNGKAGYINRAGEAVIPPQFVYAHLFVDGYAYAQTDEKSGIIDKTGAFVHSTPVGGGSDGYMYIYQGGMARISDGYNGLLIDIESGAHLDDGMGEFISCSNGLILFVEEASSGYVYRFWEKDELIRLGETGAGSPAHKFSLPYSVSDFESGLIIVEDDTGRAAAFNVQGDIVVDWSECLEFYDGFGYVEDPVPCPCGCVFDGWELEDWEDGYQYWTEKFSGGCGNYEDCDDCNHYDYEDKIVNKSGKTIAIVGYGEDENGSWDRYGDWASEHMLVVHESTYDESTGQETSGSCLMDSEGEYIIAPGIYDEIVPNLNGGLITVTKNTKTGILLLDGYEIPEYPNYSGSGTTAGNVTIVDNETGVSLDLSSESFDFGSGADEFVPKSVSIITKAGKDDKWVAYNESKHEIGKLLKKGWLSLKFASEVNGGGTVVEIPAVEKRAKTAKTRDDISKKLAAWYPSSTPSKWILGDSGKFKSGDVSAVRDGLEYCVFEGKKPDENWKPVPAGGFDIATAKTVYAVREAAKEAGGKFYPATAFVKITDKGYGKATKVSVKNGTAKLKKGMMYRVNNGAITGPLADKAAVDFTPGQKVEFWMGATGKKPETIKQTVTVS
ncbi:MAG: WG repeat-containing protein [Oscillospiraceae bacterium]|nr:WG repeat-containing protein [Oscillospiraceae bacterium]